MECVIILNGDKPNLQKDFFNCKYIICADGAYNFAKKSGLKIDLLLGDFDSLGFIPENENILKFNKDKDFTDGELAINEALKKDFENITIIGATGKRDDHWYANILLLYKALLKGKKAVIKTDYSEFFMFDKSIKLNLKKGFYFSIVPFSDCLHIINTEGLKYKIIDKILYRNETLGISNVITENTVKIDVEKGCGIIFITYEVAKNL